MKCDYVYGKMSGAYRDGGTPMDHKPVSPEIQENHQSGEPELGLPSQLELPTLNQLKIFIIFAPSSVSNNPLFVGGIGLVIIYQHECFSCI